VVKRHGFHGQNKTHGNKDQERMPGSIGSQQQQRVLKGTRMGGRMGGDRVTTSNLEVIGIDPASNIILIKGAVPGARNGLVMIQGKGELKIFKNEEVKIKNEEKVEEAIDEVKVEETAGEVKEAAEGEVVNK
jgi:large subunit ribosomal protein L3